MKQDVPREQLPKGAVWNMVDWIPELGSPLRKRGGYNRPFNPFGAGSYAAGVGFAPFAEGSRVLGVTDGNALYEYTPGSATATARGNVNNIAAPPVFYRNKLYFPDLDGTAVPSVQSYNSSATAMGASTPTGAVACVFKDHLVLARSSSQTNRKWFANGGDPTSWDTGVDGQWDDSDFPVQGMAATRNMILVFGEGQTSRVRFDVIPGVSGSDYVEEPLFQIGCSDPASIAVNDDYVVFANSSGVYMTDGIGIQDLTEAGGIKQYWLTTLAGYSSSYTIAAAIFRNKYHVSVMNGASFVDSLVCDIVRKVWWRNSNLDATMMVATPVGLFDVSPTLYMAERGATRVADLGTMYTPAAAYKADGDSSSVLPVLETPHYKGKPGLKRWRRLYASYGLTDAATDNPTLQVSYNTDPVATSYSNTGSFVETSAYTRQRMDVKPRSEGVQFKLVQTAASANTYLHALEAEVHTLEGSKLI